MAAEVFCLRRGATSIPRPSIRGESEPSPTVQVFTDYLVRLIEVRRMDEEGRLYARRPRLTSVPAPPGYEQYWLPPDSALSLFVGDHGESPM